MSLLANLEQGNIERQPSQSMINDTSSIVTVFSAKLQSISDRGLNCPICASLISCSKFLFFFSSVSATSNGCNQDSLEYLPLLATML